MTMKASIPYRLLKALPKMPYSTDQTRSSIQAIHFQPDQRDPANSALAVATDGHAMAVVKFPGVVSESGCITASDALRLAKLCDLTEKAAVGVSFPAEIDGLAASVITKAGIVTLALTPYDSEFPDFINVMPRPDELKPCNATFDPGLLAHGCRLLQAFALKEPMLRVHGAADAHTPAVFSLGNSEHGYEVWYVLMPMRNEESAGTMMEDYGSLRDAVGDTSAP